MSNGDSLDDFVFPPFVPTASTRPAQAPPAAPPPAEPEPPASPSGGARMAMPWDAETPIVRTDDAPPAPPAAAPAQEDDLPWLEVPTPREAAAPVDEAAPAAGETLPDWMTWDQRDETAAEAEARDTVAPIAGLEDFIPADDQAAGAAPPASAEWAEAQPDGEPAPFDAEAAAGGFPELSFEAPNAYDAPPAEEAPSPDEWSLATPEAAEPPAVDEAPLPTFEESPAAAEPSYEVSVDDGALVVESAAEPQPFVADDEAVMAAEPDPFTAASVAEAESASPAEAAGAPSPFDDVASRLEEIARMLRHRPDELLAGGSTDPLALLVTGYVMGYTARR